MACSSQATMHMSQALAAMLLKSSTSRILPAHFMRGALSTVAGGRSWTAPIAYLCPVTMHMSQALAAMLLKSSISRILPAHFMQGALSTVAGERSWTAPITYLCPVTTHMSQVMTATPVSYTHLTLPTNREV